MSSLAIALIVFACVFGSAMLGLFLRPVLPASHLDGHTTNVVNLATGFVGTLAALVLGLLISSAKTTFDQIEKAAVQNAADTVLLDRVLAQYGPETKEIRELLKSNSSTALELLLSGDESKQAKLNTAGAVARVEQVQAKTRALSPPNDALRGLQLRALAIEDELSGTRWLLIVQSQGTVSVVLLVVLVFWLCMIFAAWALFSPGNLTVIAALLACALSVSGAAFLILELDRPLTGVIRISSAPLQEAVAHLGE